MAGRLYPQFSGKIIMGSRLNVSISEEDRTTLVAFAKLYPREQISLSEAVRRAINIAYTHKLACQELADK